MRKKNPKKRCSFCRRWYQPDPRTYKEQLACKKAACRKQRRAQANRSYHIRHPRRNENWKLKVRDWARAYPYYWRQYRKNHPDYCIRDNLRRELSAKRSSFSAKTDAMRQMSVEKLLSTQKTEVGYSAKDDAINRRVDGIVDYLLWTVNDPYSAKYRRYGIKEFSPVG